MTCDCIATFDAELSAHNGKIATGFNLVGNSLKVIHFVETEKLDARKRKAVPKIVMTYCPFCGVKFDPSEPEEVDE